MKSPAGGRGLVTVTARLTELEVISCPERETNVVKPGVPFQMDSSGLIHLIYNGKDIFSPLDGGTCSVEVAQTSEPVWSFSARYSLRVFMSWLLPCCLSAPPLATGWRLGEVWLSGRWAWRSPPPPSLSSSLPEALAESEELLLLPLLLICSITSTSARSSAHPGGKGQRSPPPLRPSSKYLFKGPTFC